MRRHASVPQSESRAHLSDFRLVDDQIEMMSQYEASILSQQFATSVFAQRSTSQDDSDQTLIPHISSIFQILTNQSVCIE